VSTRSPALCLCSLNVHRLLLVAAMISAKFTEDRYSGLKSFIPSFL
jgi:hypothetical protein